MGQAIAAIAPSLGAQVAGGSDVGDNPADLARKADVLVDFSAPAALEAHLEAARAARVRSLNAPPYPLRLKVSPRSLARRPKVVPLSDHGTRIASEDRPSLPERSVVQKLPFSTDARFALSHRLIYPQRRLRFCRVGARPN